MRPEWLWDKDIPVEEIQAILKDPSHERFISMAALLLSRNNMPKEIFDQYLDRKIFVQHWTRIKRQMRKDSWNDPRIIFWQAVYESLVSELKEKGISIRPRRENIASDAISQRVAEKIKAARQDLALTQNELAERIGISQQIISRVEKGRSNMRLSTLEKILRFLGEKIMIESRSVWLLDRISDGQRETVHA